MGEHSSSDGFTCKNVPLLKAQAIECNGASYKRRMRLRIAPQLETV
jgi:hypothetical protein